ncbi:MAG: DMT family transporter [Pseudomonadota bacterium]
MENDVTPDGTAVSEPSGDRRPERARSKPETSQSASLPDETQRPRALLARDVRGRPGQAIGFVIAAMVAISINDATIKFLSGDYPLHQMVLVRSAIALVFSISLLWAEGGPSLLRTRTPGLHALRAALIVLANLMFFAGLAVLPLAQATALFFIAPLLITLLGIPVLGERVGRHRIAAICVGLLGVVVMLNPFAQEPGTAPLWALLLPLAAALCYAGMQVLTRKLGVGSRASAMAIYIQCMFLLVSGVFFLAVGDGRYAEMTQNPALEFLLRAWIWPEREDWHLFVLIGVMGGGIGYLLSQAYRIGQPATVASFEYVSLPLAVLWGWVIWGEIPGGETAIGIFFIVGAGLYVFLRERRRAAPLASAQTQRRL